MIGILVGWCSYEYCIFNNCCACTCFLPLVVAITIPCCIYDIGTPNVFINWEIGCIHLKSIAIYTTTQTNSMVWINIGWFIILIGAEIAYAFQNVDNYNIED